jgi:hypothetical protein
MWRQIAILTAARAHDDPPHDDLRGPGPVAPFKRVTPRRIDIALALILIFVSIIIGFAIQQKAWQRDQDRHDACVDAWGSSLVGAVQANRTATKHYTAATAVRDRARADWETSLGDLTRILVALRAHPPTAVTSDFVHVLNRTAHLSGKLRVAQVAVDRAAGHVAATQQAHPLPVLRCGP